MSIHYIFLLTILLAACSNGNQTTGDSGERPDTLVRQEEQTPAAPDLPDEQLLESHLWELDEFMGRPYDTTMSAGGLPPYLTFSAADNTMGGYSGCNDFGAQYEIKEGSRIRFTEIISTLKACLEPHIETEFLDMLHTVDNYNLYDSMLVLNKARMAPMARFRAAVKPPAAN